MSILSAYEMENVSRQKKEESFFEVVFQWINMNEIFVHDHKT